MIPCPKQQLLPTELLVLVFAFLDGSSVAACTSVCRHWASVIQQYDGSIWNVCARHDFERPNKRRFWPLLFPNPEKLNSDRMNLHRSWQDMYRISKNWYNGNCAGYFPATKDPSSHLRTLNYPFAIVGTPQEQIFYTTLSVTASGHIVRSNPTYRSASGGQCLLVQCPHTRKMQILDAQPPGHAHAIVCHYTCPSSNWLVTGGLDGTVALWDLTSGTLSRMWSGHRGRVLCVSMNDEVVVSGGTDSMIRVWDIFDDDRLCTAEWPSRRGMIDVSLYLSARSDWYQGVGEIAVHGHLVACAHDATGPVLIFSLLTGSLVFELQLDDPTFQEDMTVLTKLCITPFFVLVKGKTRFFDDPVYPRVEPKTPQPKAYKSSFDDLTPPPGMTPYQLYQHLEAFNDPLNSAMRSCINVWDLQHGKLAYRLAPPIEGDYAISDMRVSPDFSKVFAVIEIRQHPHIEERIYCWDFAGTRDYTKIHEASALSSDSAEASQLAVIEIDARKDKALGPQQSRGKSWACFM